MLTTLLGVARLPFLTLSVLCVGLAAAGAWYQHGSLSIALLLLVMLLALAAHISVNAFNEYFDFRSGLDFLTERTPFSGGSGTLVAAPRQARLALWLALGTLLLVSVLGLYLSARIDWHLLWLGLAGVLLIYSYTDYINKSPLLCLLAPGLGFGALMTFGSYWVLAGAPDMLAVSLSGLVLLLVCNLLLLNQFPDVEADRKVGRRHLPIVLGRAQAANIFSALLLLCYLWLLLSVVLGWLPAASLLALLSLPLALGLLRDIKPLADSPKQLPPLLGRNVLLTHALPALVLLGLVLARLMEI